MSKRKFNLSRWALEHPALTRYLMVALLAWEWVHMCGRRVRVLPGMAVPLAVLAAVVAGVLSGLLVARRIRDLDLVAVLKTRE